jgi:hypothetical protein
MPGYETRSMLPQFPPGLSAHRPNESAPVRRLVVDRGHDSQKGDAGAVADVDSGGGGNVSNSLDYKRVGSGGNDVYDDSTERIPERP